MKSVQKGNGKAGQVVWINNADLGFQEMECHCGRPGHEECTCYEEGVLATINGKVVLIRKCVSNEIGVCLDWEKCHTNFQIRE
jgi:hypothetical protein